MSSSLERMLESVELRTGFGHRQFPVEGQPVTLPAGALTLVYVVEGALRGIPAHSTGCAVDIDAEGLTTPIPAPPASTLRPGDAFLSLGRSPSALTAAAESDVLLIDIELSGGGALASALPDFLSVTGFATLEPAAAALAETMGYPTAAGACNIQRGDSVICGIMAKTVLLTLIRSWAANGCAPQGWPAARDPFLERVVDAIHREPGADWTVENLASLGAMSRSVFAERFRSALGRSPVSYVTEVRMDIAKRMLETGRTVIQIAHELGYSSEDGFSRAFRRHTGIVPSMWRTERTLVS